MPDKPAAEAADRPSRSSSFDAAEFSKLAHVTLVHFSHPFARFSVKQLRDRPTTDLTRFLTNNPLRPPICLIFIIFFISVVSVFHYVFYLFLRAITSCSGIRVSARPNLSFGTAICLSPSIVTLGSEFPYEIRCRCGSLGSPERTRSLTRPSASLQVSLFRE